MEEDLKSLAKLKIKLDILQEQYNNQAKDIKAKYKIGTIKDPDGVLSINLTPSSKRSFKIDGVREVFGDKADICIEETIDPTKFDALAKSKKEYIISKEEQDKCFVLVPQNPSLNWDGLDTYKNQLILGLNNGKTNTEV